MCACLAPLGEENSSSMMREFLLFIRFLILDPFEFEVLYCTFLVCYHTVVSLLVHSRTVLVKISSVQSFESLAT